VSGIEVQVNRAADAYEKAVSRAHRGIEWYIVLATVAYLLCHFAAFAHRGFKVSNGEDVFAFYAQEAAR
jgi:hypothetical protein